MSNIRFEDYAGRFHTFSANKPPELKFVWYAYKNGTVTEASTRQGAEAISANIEKVATKESQAEVDAYWSELRALECEATEAWHVALRHAYANIPDKVYYHLMGEAWSRGHSAGYDEIANHLDTLVDLALDLKRLWVL